MSEGDLSSRVPFLRAASVPGAAREAAEFEAARPTDLSAGRFGGLSQLEGLAINPESTGAVMLATASLGRGLTSRSAVRSVSPAFRETAPAPEAYEAARPTRRVREPR